MTVKQFGRKNIILILLMFPAAGVIVHLPIDSEVRLLKLFADGYVEAGLKASVSEDPWVSDTVSLKKIVQNCGIR